MPHIHNKIDFTICAYIIYEQKVLLIEHRTLRKWLPIGGHIELDEHPESALFREIGEESGIKKSSLTILSTKPSIKDSEVKFLCTPNYLDIHAINKAHQHIGMVYFLISKTETILLNEQEHTNIKWFTKKDLHDQKYEISKTVKFYAAKALSLSLRGTK